MPHVSTICVDPTQMRFMQIFYVHNRMHHVLSFPYTINVTETLKNNQSDYYVDIIYRYVRWNKARAKYHLQHHRPVLTLEHVVSNPSIHPSIHPSKSPTRLLEYLAHRELGYPP